MSQWLRQTDVVHVQVRHLTQLSGVLHDRCGTVPRFLRASTTEVSTKHTCRVKGCTVVGYKNRPVAWAAGYGFVQIFHHRHARHTHHGALTYPWWQPCMSSKTLPHLRVSASRCLHWCRKGAAIHISSSVVWHAPASGIWLAGHYSPSPLTRLCVGEDSATRSTYPLHKFSILSWVQGSPQEPNNLPETS